MEQIFILKKDVPKYLQSTAFYTALSCDDDSPAAISTSHYKEDDRLESVDDLRALVSTLHFWGPFEIPNKLIEFVLASNLTHEIYSLHESYPEFKFLKALADVNAAVEEEKMSASIRANDVLVLRKLSEHKPFPTDSYCIAAAAGSLDSLQYLREVQPDIAEWDSNTTRAAAGNGHLSCLQFLVENECMWDGEVLLVAAASNGHENCLQYLFEKGARWSEAVCTAAATRGNLRCLILAFNRRPNDVDTVALVKAINLTATAAGHLNCFLMLRCVQLDIDFCRAAAKNGQLQSLRFLREQNCPWGENVCTAAARYGHIECLRYLREQGCPWHQRDTCRAAARSGNIACLRYTYSLRFRNDLLLCRGAAFSGVVECLEFLHDEGKCRWDSEVCAEAAKYGHFACLQYAHENCCLWDRRVCINAARGGHLACLIYACEHGCLLDPFLTNQAAQYGQLPCLQYLHEQGCPWDSDEQGCPWQKEATSHVCSTC